MNGGAKLCALGATLIFAVGWPGHASRLRAQQRATFIPYTDAPELLNRAQVKRAVRRLYPAALRARGVKDTVWVTFVVAVDGTSRDATIRLSSGHPVMDSAALKVATLMRFTPALRYKEPVAVHVILPIVFEPGKRRAAERRKPERLPPDSARTSGA